MTKQELETYCKDNGVPCKTVGERFRVMDLTQLPEHMRTDFDDLGFFTGSSKDAAPAESETDSDTLPEDFPGRAALEEAGITTLTEVREVEDLTEIAGIGEATAAKIQEALED